MTQRSTAAVLVVVFLGWLSAGCASPASQNGATTQPAQAAVAATPAPARPAPPPPTPAPPRPPAPAPAPAAPAAPVAPAAPAPPENARTYTIKPGDSLWKISKEVYGDATKYEQIQRANPALDPLVLKPGTVIVIP